MPDSDDGGLGAVGDVQFGEDGADVVAKEPWKGEAIWLEDVQG